MHVLWEFFTTWAFVALLVAVLVQLVVRMSGCRSSFPANFAVIASAVVGVMGSWVVAKNMCANGVGEQPGKLSRAALDAHLYMHMLPLALAIVLLTAWPQLVGTPSSAGPLSVTLGTLTLLFVAYLATPSNGATWLRKVQAVYHVERPLAFILSGAGTAVVMALLLGLHGHNLVNYSK